MTYAIVLCRYIVGGVLLAAAIRKAWGRPAFAAFAGAVRRLAGVPARAAPAVAAAVIAVEAATGTALLVGLAPTAAAAAAVVVLLAFTAVLVREVRSGSRAPCLCLGRTEEPVAWRHVWRNGALIGLAALGAAGAGPASAAGRLLCLAAAAVAVLLVLLLDDIAALFRT